MRNRKHDIEKYLRGELSPAEMHALEKEALSDPFLAEALEGVEQTGADNFLYDLHQLNRSVHDRMRRKARKDNKTIRMWGWTSAVAATILLIAISGFLVVNILRDQQQRTESMSKVTPPVDNTDVNDSLLVDEEEKSPLAMMEQKEKAPLTSDAPQRRARSKRDRPAPAQQPVVEAEANAHNRAQEETALQLSDTERVTSDAVPVDSPTASGRKTEELPATDETEKREQFTNTARIADADATSKKIADHPVEVGALQKLPPMTSRAATGRAGLIKGKVTDESGQELPGVNVIVKGTSVATTTNAQGEYQLQLNGDTTTLVFSFIGFESKEVPVSANNDVSVTLEADISTLSEVVTTGYGGSESKADNSFQSALPDGGRASFKSYLATAVKYPQEAIRNKTEGRVTVRFAVEPTGQLTDFEVLKGIGSGCEEELIRAIRQGPDWNPGTMGGNPVRDKVRVTFKFQLPK